VPSVSLYLDFDKKATTFFGREYVLFAHVFRRGAKLGEFVKSVGKRGRTAGKIERFAQGRKRVIRPVMGKTFPQPVENPPPKRWKSRWVCGFSTLSTEFSTSGKWETFYRMYKQ